MVVLRMCAIGAKHLEDALQGFVAGSGVLEEPSWLSSPNYVDLEDY